MNSLILALLLISGALFIFIIIFIMMINKSIGFSNLFVILKAKRKQRKGWGLVGIWTKTGTKRLFPHQFGSEEFLKIKGKKDEKYIYNPRCVAPGYFGIQTIEFFDGDADPINPFTGLQNVTSAKALENMMARAVKAEKMASANPIKDFIEKHWMTIGIGLLIFIALFIYGYMAMNSNMTKLALMCGKGAVVAAKNLTVAGA